MRFWAYSKEAWTSLMATKQRTFLALFGIIIAIASVIGLVSTGGMITDEAMEQFKTLGTDKLFIRIYDYYPENNHALSALDIALNLDDKVNCIKQTAPYVALRLVHMNDGNNNSINGFGVQKDFTELFKLSVAHGRFISNLDGQQRFVVLGAEAAERLELRDDAERLIGQDIALNTSTYTIIGILNNIAGDTEELNEAVFVPMEHAFFIEDSESVSHMIAQMHADVDEKECAQAAEDYLLRRSPWLYIRTRTADDLLAQMHEQQELLDTLLLAIGSISLLIGGVSIMNVLLISVSERRQEIGIRAALGAKRQDIRMQFLIEAMILSITGGMLGTLLGISITYGVAWYKEWTFSVEPNVLLAGIGISLATGILFGFLPAHKAANLNPIDALRSD
jgi:putative ABC transport system permease protein